jgi:ABC-2 type transport system ATP-binding protein
MDAGRLLEIDTPTALVRRLGAGARILLDPDALTDSEAAATTGVNGVERDASSLVLHTNDAATVLTALAHLSAEGRDPLAGLQVRGATLEDVFLALTGREYRA